MTRLVIYSALTILVGSWVFSSFSNGIKESPLGQELIQRRQKLEQMQ